MTTCYLQWSRRHGSGNIATSFPESSRKLHTRDGGGNEYREQNLCQYGQIRRKISTLTDCSWGRVENWTVEYKISRTILSELTDCNLICSLGSRDRNALVAGRRSLQVLKTTRVLQPSKQVRDIILKNFKLIIYLSKGLIQVRPQGPQGCDKGFAVTRLYVYIPVLEINGNSKQGGEWLSYC